MLLAGRLPFQVEASDWLSNCKSHAQAFRCIFSVQPAMWQLHGPGMCSVHLGPSRIVCVVSARSQGLRPGFEKTPVSGKAVCHMVFYA